MMPILGGSIGRSDPNLENRLISGLRTVSR